MTFTRQLLFNCLVLLSIIGFSVKPLLAQNKISNSDSTSVKTKVTDQDSTKNKKTKEKKRKSRKKRSFWAPRKFRPMGCPEF